MKKKFIQLLSSSAFRFVIMIGIINLFADMTYEGGAAINGPFLGLLGASAATISIIAGLGEFLGYGVRSIAGYISDKTGRYWLLTFIGYVVNLVAVPVMALAESWQIAALLIIAERVGRGFRKPTIESMLSYATGRLGKGWVYALNTALDETGAVLGPLLMAVILYFKGDYRVAYSFLWLSTILAIATLGLACATFPIPSKLEQRPARANQFGLIYWLYMLAGALFAAGLMSYELVSYHLAKNDIIAAHWIPLLLAFTTLCGIGANLLLGKLFDRFGLVVVLIAVILSALFSPFIFLGGFALVLIAMPLWGISYAVQDTLLKAIVVDFLPKGQRSFAFGLFYTGYGCGWLVGSIIAGLLYQYSLLALSLFALIAQLSSVPVFILASKKRRIRL
jgi:MFS family permease